MHTMLMLSIAFLALSGLALLIKKILRTNLGEGYFLCASVIIIVLFGSGKLAGSFTPGFILLIAAGAAGIIWQGAAAVFQPKSITVSRQNRYASAREDWSLPAVMVLIAVLLYGMIFFHGVFLQHPDDLHWYGPVLRYMTQNNQLVNWSESIIPYQPYAASFFDLFFTKFAGDSEHVMYASAFFLNWIGFILPMSRMTGKNWRKVFLYSLIIFVSLYSLYLHSYKSLYVDMPCIAWAGGLAGWWTGRDRARTKTNILVLVTGLATLIYYKQMVGMLMVLLILLFIIFEFEAEKCRTDRDMGRKRTRYVVGISFLLFLAAAAVAGTGLLLLAKGRLTGLVPASLRNMLELMEFSMSKMIRHAGALGNSFFGTPLHGKSDLKIYPFACLVGLLIWQTADAWLDSDDTGIKIRNVYVVMASMGYIFALAVSYVVMFTYEEAVKAKSSRRYFSILIMFLFIICLSRWIQKEGKTEHIKKVRLFATLGLLLFFITGWNDRIISTATAFNEYQIPNSGDIIETRKEALKIGSDIGQDDKVFFINQNDGTELPQNVALCYLMERVSNFIIEPWRFTEDGCKIRATEVAYPTVNELPALLEQGGYTYLWVYRTDDYLAGSLQSMFDVDITKDKMSDGQLFHVIYEDGHAEGLELTENLNQGAVLLEDTDEKEELE